MNKILYVFILIFIFINVFAYYNPGELPFTYLNVPVSPLSNALSLCSAAYISGNTDIFNPASIAFNKNRHIYFATTSYIAQTYMGYIEYNKRNIRGNVKYFNSGQMEMRDSLNNYLGDFASNILLCNVNYGYSINNNMHIGGGMLMGAEFVPDFQQYAIGVNLGFLYTDIIDIFDVGIYINNAGISYSNDIDLLPARIIAGIALDNPKLPINVYADIGKVLDSKYFYAFAVEWTVVSSMQDKKDIELQETIFPEIETQSDTIKESISLEIRAFVQPDTLITQDSIYTDSINSDTIINTQSDTLDAEDEFTSYEDYLKSLEMEQEDKQNEITEEHVPQYTEKKKNVFDKLEFVLRGGFSSDKSMLMTGATSDLLAGLTAGFSIKYDIIGIDYGVKFWGELGIAHSIGVKVLF